MPATVLLLTEPMVTISWADVPGTFHIAIPFARLPEGFHCERV
jgi:hypothetical protein